MCVNLKWGRWRRGDFFYALHKKSREGERNDVKEENNHRPAQQVD